MTFRDRWVDFWHALPPFRGRLAIARIVGERLLTTKRNPIAFATLANGYRVKIDLRWRDYDTLYYFRMYEEPLIRLIRRTLDSKGGSFVDIGANVGIITISVADLLKRNGNRALAIEPLPQNFSFLRESIERNGLEDVILPIKVAIGDSDGTLDLWAMSTGAIANAMPLTWRRGDQQQPSETERVTVPMRPLDSLIAEHRVTDVRFVKIDVDGAEMFVLKGARDLLMRDRPLVYAEMHLAYNAANATSTDDLLAFADSIGYDIRYLLRNGELGDSLPAGSVQLDAVLVPR